MNPDECKGCGLCVEACTPRVLRLAEHLNRYGYHPAVYTGHGCTACGLCFYVCPEPGGITVYKRAVVPAAKAAIGEPALV
jgi:NAD-dependent dihydropyrimidine dehydrogenase PreA subunit